MVHVNFPFALLEYDYCRCLTSSYADETEYVTEIITRMQSHAMHIAQQTTHRGGRLDKINPFDILVMAKMHPEIPYIPLHRCTHTHNTHTYTHAYTSAHIYTHTRTQAHVHQSKY